MTMLQLTHIPSRRVHRVWHLQYRQQRMLMVQTVSQYKFVHTVLIKYLAQSRIVIVLILNTLLVSCAEYLFFK